MKLELKQNRKDLFIKTSLWNSIKEVFEEKKKIDISSSLISINLMWNTLLVKTYNPLINEELSNFSDEILDKFYDKIKNLAWINPNFVLKFK